MSNNLAFVFPGQGSQQVGMLSDLYETYGVVKDTFIEASDALGFDLGEIILEGPAEKLNSTEITQPALLACSVALWRLWQEKTNSLPGYLAGHSLGEYSALTCAGSLSLNNAVEIVHLRGKLMQEAVPAGTGGMAAILGLDDEQVVAACTQAEQGQVVSAVNFNSPGQVVIAGDALAVDRAIKFCKEAGAKRTLPLPVSVPSHCALMKPAAERLADSLSKVSFLQPVIPVIQNVNAGLAETPEQIRENLLQQLYSPVLWVDSVQKLASFGVDTLLECGPGKVLSGLNKRIDRKLNVSSLENSDSLQKAIDRFIN